MAAPHTLTGVVGLERDLGAADQIFNGRMLPVQQLERRRRGHAHDRDACDRQQLHAVFIDMGPAVNAPPTVAMTAPAINSTGNPGTPITLTATASDSDGAIADVEFLRRQHGDRCG